MSIRIPKHIEKLHAYKPGKTPEQLAAEYNFKEKAILWNNENPMGTSPRAIEAAQAAMWSANAYPDPLALDLREVLAEHLGTQLRNIAVGNGSESLLMNVFKAFTNPGDEVLTSEGTFVIIPIWSQINNLELKQVPLTPNYGFNLKKIHKSITEKTRIIYLSNPNNPTGSMISGSALRAFVEQVPKDILIIIDEAYFYFSTQLNSQFPNSMELDAENVITLRTLSKSYGLAGFRIGYAVAHEALISHLNNVKLTFEPSSIAQAAACGALTDNDFLHSTLRNNFDGIWYFYEAFEELGLDYVPSYANFVMLDLKTAEQAQLIVEKLMQRGVFIRLLTGCGLPHCVRISVGRMRENRFCIENLKEVLQEL